jgi:hypothetical protein
MQHEAAIVMVAWAFSALGLVAVFYVALSRLFFACSRWGKRWLVNHQTTGEDSSFEI